MSPSAVTKTTDVIAAPARSTPYVLKLRQSGAVSAGTLRRRTTHPACAHSQASVWTAASATPRSSNCSVSATSISGGPLK